MRSQLAEGGFTIIELLTAVAIIGIVTAITVPYSSRTLDDLKLRSDARAIHNMVGLAKMRAAARFTRERLYVDLATKTFHLQYLDKTTTPPSWVTEGGSTTLSTGIDFGFADLSTPPPDTQASLFQAPACLTNAGIAIANTACVVFNSRGIPIDSNGAPYGNTAFYVTDTTTGVYAVTVSATPLVRLWWSAASDASWIHK